jgi:AraC-like DNA-binding protein
MNLTYQEYTPTPALRPFVHCFWSLQADGHPHELSPVQRCFPSGMIEWITHVKGPSSIGFKDEGNFAFPQSLLTGICDRATAYVIYGHSEMFGIRLHPEAAMDLLDINLKVFRNSCLDTKDLNDRECNILNDQLLEASTHAERIRQVEAFFLNRLNRQNPESNYFTEALRMLRTEEAPSIKDLSRKVFVGERQLQRTFQSMLGISPKSYFRVIRLYKALEMGLANKGSFTDIAYRLGYADPAHFNRDFKEYFGIAPAAHFSSIGLKAVA